MPAFKPQGELKEYTFKPKGDLQEFNPNQQTAPIARSGEMSAITGQAVPSAEEKIQAGKAVAAAGVRYGVPVAAGLATGGWSIPAQIGVGAAASGASEFTARQIENIGTDPTLDSLWQDIKAGGIAGGIDAGVSTVLHGLGKGILWGAKKLLLPKTISPEVESAMGVLATPSKAEPARKWYKWKGGEPFSLSPHQLNPEEKGFIYHIESIARTGSGAGKFRKFDERNLKHIQAALDDYLVKRANQQSAPEFGAMINRILGKTNQPGELFKPVEAYKSYLYGEYKNELANFADTKIDGSDMLNFFKTSKDVEMNNIYRKLADSQLLPKNLKDVEVWSKLDVQDADEAIKQINSFWKPGKENELWNNNLKRMKMTLSKPYEEFVNGQPGLKQYRDTANKFYGQAQDAMRSTTIKTVRDKLMQQKPSTISALFNPTKGNAAATYDNLMGLKKSLYFSADTPGVISQKISGIGRHEAEKLWERDVLRPLRFDFIAGLTDNNGVFNADKALKRFAKIENDGAPQLLEELFGSKKQVDEVKKLFSAMQHVQNTRPEGSIFIKMKTYAAFAATGAGVWSYVTSDDPKRIAAGLAGSAAVLVGPSVLAKTLTNPRLTRALYEGVTDQRIFTGWSPKLSLALRKMGQQKAASEIAKDLPSGDAAQFYSFAPVEQENNE